MPRHLVLSALILVLVSISIAPAQQSGQKPGEKATEAEIRKTLATLEESFNRGDAKGVAACWTPDGEFIGPRAERIDGRDKIEAAFHDFLATHKDSKLRLNIAAWRLVADDVALVDLIAAMTPLPEGLEAEPASALVLVKHEGRWLIGSMHEALGGTPSHNIQLQKLNWMVGDWQGEGANESGVSVQSTCDWTAGSSYLIRKFTVEQKQGVVLAGTEVIGWDPRAHRLRSWTFDSDGGFGESVWTRDGDRWIIKHTGMLANGGDVSATHIVTVVNADTLLIQSQDRTVNGEKQPDMPDVKLKRRPAQEETKKSSEPAKPPRQVLP